MPHSGCLAYHGQLKKIPSQHLVLLLGAQNEESGRN